MVISDYLPSTTLVTWFLVFYLLHFESQRWARAVQTGNHGSSAIATALPMLTSILAGFLEFGIILAIFWFEGWRPAGGMLAVRILVGLAYSWISGVLIGDRFSIWFLATLSAWPVGAYLIFLTYQELN